MTAKPKRAPMPREQRAKQFLPFAGVKGLDEALRAQEQKMLREYRVELDDGTVEEISAVLAELGKGDVAAGRFYRKKEKVYQTFEATVIRNVPETQVLKLRDGNGREFAVSYSDLRCLRKRLPENE